ncbi:hypothetical protein [Amycolatopsis jejuensis]|uniref:hypothetical protein n=1 Tax=Amycolatopsis jejuensis TaxID=330084 RepID=UPI00052419CE|nr:hypothetical protein [Amycolatopsis jejuensis]
MTARIEDRLFEIISGMYTAGPVVIEETSLVAAARIVHWGEQLIAVLEEFGLSDEFLSKWRSETLQNLSLGLSDPTKFSTWVADATGAFVTEAKRRNLAEGTG